jgi:hypothetical protein
MPLFPIGNGDRGVRDGDPLEKANGYSGFKKLNKVLYLNIITPLVQERDSVSVCKAVIDD